MFFISNTTSKYEWDREISRIMGNDDRHKKIIDERVVSPTIKIFDDINNYGLKERVGQTEMALDIAETIRDKEHFMAEAGVGIGKSLGYLIPSILAKKHLRGPIVIVTSSIALSEQLMGDINQAKDIINKVVTNKIDITSVLAKGANNYVCLQKINDDNILSVPNWILDEANNCLERSDFSKPITDNQWKKINGCDCIVGKCPSDLRKKCAYVHMKNLIGDKGKIDIIVVNMDMFLISMFKEEYERKGFINNDMSLVIIDEAHNLEAKTRSVLTKIWTRREMTNIVERSLLYLQRYGSANDFKTLNDVKECIFKYFDIVSRVTEKKNKSALYEHDVQRIRIPNVHITFLEKWAKCLDSIYTTLTFNDSLLNQSEALIDELGKLSVAIKNLSLQHLPESNDLFWLESISHNNYALCYAPKHIDEELKYLLFEQYNFTVVLTSATLTQPGNTLEQQYYYQTSSIGFKGETYPSKPSPFPYKKNSIMYIPQDIADPVDNREKYLEDIAIRIIDLCNVTNGRTLVLFTAKEDLKTVQRLILKNTTKWEVFSQLDGSSPTVLKQRLINTGGVLLSTGLWEGFNVQGPSLSSVIITKLPFPVPDPIIEYKISKAQDRYKILIPEMLIKLRQGAGRLIRDDSDFGVLSILDPRAHMSSEKKYVQDIYESLPIKNCTNNLNDIKEFFREHTIA